MKNISALLTSHLEGEAFEYGLRQLLKSKELRESAAEDTASSEELLDRLARSGVAGLALLVACNDATSLETLTWIAKTRRGEAQEEAKYSLERREKKGKGTIAPGQAQWKAGAPLVDNLRGLGGGRIRSLRGETLREVAAQMMKEMALFADSADEEDWEELAEDFWHVGINPGEIFAVLDDQSGAGDRMTRLLTDNYINLIDHLSDELDYYHGIDESSFSGEEEAAARHAGYVVGTLTNAGLTKPYKEIRVLLDPTTKTETLKEAVKRLPRNTSSSLAEIAAYTHPNMDLEGQVAVLRSGGLPEETMKRSRYYATKEHAEIIALGLEAGEYCATMLCDNEHDWIAILGEETAARGVCRAINTVEDYRDTDNLERLADYATKEAVLELAESGTWAFLEWATDYANIGDAEICAMSRNPNIDYDVCSKLWEKISQRGVGGMSLASLTVMLDSGGHYLADEKKNVALGILGASTRGNLTSIVALDGLANIFTGTIDELADTVKETSAAPTEEKTVRKGAAKNKKASSSGVAAGIS